MSLFGCNIKDLSSLKPLDTQDILNQESEIKDAKIAFMSPTNSAENVIGKAPVTIMWDKPIFTLKNKRDSQRILTKLITISPQIEGSWQQLGTSGVLFEPKTDWKASTKYSFTIPFAKEAYSFQTQDMVIKNIHAPNLINKKPLEITFNQTITLAEAKKIEFIPHMDFDIRYPQEETYRYQKDDHKTIIFTPKSNWPENTKFMVTIPTPGREYQQIFRTIQPFKIINNPYKPDNVFDSLSIETNSRVSNKDIFKNITITSEKKIDKKFLEAYLKKAIKNSDYDSSWIGISPIGKHWIPNQEYTITISKNLPDIYGRKLGKDFVVKFKTQFPDTVKRMYFPHQWKNYQTGVFPKYTVNYSGTILKPQLYFERIAPKPFHKTINLTWEASPNKRVFKTLDFAQEFATEIGAQPQGIYRAELRYQKPEKRGRPSKMENLFAIGDLLVESKTNADNYVDLVARNTKGEAVEITKSFAIFKEYNQKRDLYSTEEYHQNPMKLPQNGRKYFQGFLVQSNQQWGAVTDSNNMSPYDSAVEFNPYKYKNKIRAVGFSDRPMYKPGDTVFFDTLIRKLQLKGKHTPLKKLDLEQDIAYKVSVFSPDYKELFAEERTGKLNNINGEWNIPKDAMLGSYGFNIVLNETQKNISIPFYVTEYQKPDFLVQAQWKNKQALWKEKNTAQLKAEYAFGGSLAGKEVKYKVSLFGYEPSDWWWKFPSKKDKLLTQGKAVLDQNGTLSIPVDLDVSLESANEVGTDIDWELVTLSATVHTSKSESSSVEVSVPFYKSNYQTTLQPSAYFYQLNDLKIPFEGTVKDLANQSVQTKVKAELIRRKWARNDRKDTNGDFVGEWHWVEEIIKTQNLETDEKGRFKGEFKRPKAAGQYLVRITTTDEKNRTQSQQNHFYVWTPDRDEYALRQNNLNLILPLFLQKDEHKVGDKATILFPHTEWKITNARVTLERGEVLETIEADIKNQAATFTIEPWMVPNVIGSVLIEGVDKNGHQKVKWGAIDIPVTNPNNTLSIDITPKQKLYKPGETVELEIQTHVANQPVSGQVTLAVVDQTLLALKSRKNLNLAEIFFGKLPLGVRTDHSTANFVSKDELEDIYAQIKKIKAAFENPFGGGGGSSNKLASNNRNNVDKPRGEFKDTAFWQTEIHTDKNGKATVQFKLPDNLTTWNVWAVGNTPDNAFGQGKASFKTSLPMLISPITPNFLRYGDSTQAGVLIRRNNPQTKSEKVAVTFTLEVDGETIQTEQKTVRVATEKRILFDVVIPYDQKSFLQKNKKATLSFTIHGKNSNLKDAITINRKLVAPIITSTAADLLQIDKKTTTQVVSSEDALLSNLTLKVFNSLLQNIEPLVAIAKRFNYGCSEQEITYWSAQILQNNILAATGQKVQPIDTSVLKKALQSVAQKQKRQGGFAFWSNSEASPWITAHVLEFYPLLKDYGLTFNMRKATKWLTKKMYQECTNCLSDTTRQYAAYVLLRDHVIDANELDFLTHYLSTFEAKVWFVKSVNLAGVNNVSPKTKTAFKKIQTIMNQTLRVSDRYAFWEANSDDFFAQNERITALILDNWLATNTNPSLHKKIVRYLSQSKNNISGNTALRVLVALKNYQSSLPTNNAPTEFIIKTQGQEIMHNTLEKENNFFASNTPIKPDTKQTVEYETSNQQPYFVDMELQEIHQAKDMMSTSNGFWIERSVYEVTDKKFAHPVNNLEVGKNYLVKIKVVTNRSHRQVMVEDTIVSGAEAVNFELDNTDKQLNKNQESGCYGWCQPTINHQEFYFDKARFFVDTMVAGAHEFQYIIKARLGGEYEYPAVKVSEMYNPEVMATGKGKTIEIE